MTTETKDIAIVLRPDVEPHTDPARVIGRRTTCDSAEHPYLRGRQVVVVAVLKDALCSDGYRSLTTDEEVRAAGGVGPYDRIEVAPILPGGTLSFATSDPRATDVHGFCSRARHGAGRRPRGKR